METMTATPNGSAPNTTSQAIRSKAAELRIARLRLAVDRFAAQGKEFRALLTRLPTPGSNAQKEAPKREFLDKLEAEFVTPVLDLAGDPETAEITATFLGVVLDHLAFADEAKAGGDEVRPDEDRWKPVFVDWVERGLRAGDFPEPFDRYVALLEARAARVQDAVVPWENPYLVRLEALADLIDGRGPGSTPMASPGGVAAGATGEGAEG